MQNNWYVLTGGPGSGKTTLTTALKNRGYQTLAESARYYIEEQWARGLSTVQIRANEQSFQEAVFQHKQKMHQKTDPEILTFFDRGYHDTIAYLEYHRQTIASFITKTCNQTKYKKIFVLDMLPYNQDKARIETQTTAQKLHKALIKTYQAYGQELISVPVMTVPERVEFVLNHL